jgi:hypothetical protein
MIRREKGIDFIFIIYLNTFGLIVLFILKVMNFENVALTNVVHIYRIKGMNA